MMPMRMAPQSMQAYMKILLCFALALCITLSDNPFPAKTALAASLEPPAGLTAMPFKLTNSPDANNVNLKWNPSLGATAYKLYRSAEPGGAYSLIYHGIAPEYQDLGLAVGATYYYKVTALDAEAESPPSEAISAKTFAVPDGLRTFYNYKETPPTPGVSGIKIGDTYYKYEYVRDAGGFLQINVYTSPDGMNFTLKQAVLDRNSHPDLAACKLEGINFVYNESTGKVVMIAHYENNVDYSLARIATASGLPGEDMSFHGSFRPLGNESRDIGFYSEDGVGYVLSSANNNADLMLYQLTPDYTAVEALVAKIYTGKHREAPALMKKDGYYYLFSSGTAGWYPSRGQYSSATSLAGPWSELRNIGNANTFSAQSNWVQMMSGPEATSYALRPYRWKASPGEAPMLMLPLAFNDGYAWYEYFEEIHYNPSTGIMVPEQDGMLISEGKPAIAQDSVPGSLPIHAVDGNYDTSWKSADSAWPKWWTVDLGLVYRLTNIQISWYLHNGSEAYHQYQIETSTDGIHYTLALDQMGNTRYGFTSDKLAGEARYVRVKLVDAVLHNNPNNWYTPQLAEVKVFGYLDRAESVPPTAPANLAATPVSESQIDLNWTASADNVGVAGYRIYRDGILARFSSGTSYQDTGLSASTSYSYTVKAYDASGNISASSNAVTAQTQPGNVALNKPVAFSSQQPGNEAWKIVDGSTTARWAASDSSYPQWVQIDLGATYTISRTEIVPYQNRAYRYKIETSADGVNYTLAVDRTANTEGGPVIADSFSATDARYVKLTVTGVYNAPNGWAGINEFRVFE